MKAPERIAFFTHGYPEMTSETVGRLMDAADSAGVEVVVTPDEAGKFGLDPRGTDPVPGNGGPPVDLAVVLGGDGTILSALRRFAGAQVPVFAFNFGAIGFLASVDHGEEDDGLRRVLSGDFEVLDMPALVTRTDSGAAIGVNDISVARTPGGRVAELAYAVAGEQLGQVRCDGLVASTPVGSTGYNLANGGPVLAWGVEGFAVSFISPHSLTARALVVATEDALTVTNASQREAVEVTTDGRPVHALEPGAELEIRFERDRVLLAQIPGFSFYNRLRAKFGRLAY